VKPEIASIIADIEASEKQEDYDAVNTLWLVLLKAANLMQGEKEHQRMLALIQKMPTKAVGVVLEDPGVDRLLNLDPPLETILASPHERLDGQASARELEDLRSMRASDPYAALASLGHLLKRIRNKREHGFKSRKGSRDREILYGTRSILKKLAKVGLGVVNV